MKILYTRKFQRVYKKLSREIKGNVQSKESIFRSDCFDSQLKTHKLQGILSNLWAFSVDYKTRIIFEFIDTDTVLFHTIGGHELY